MRPPYDVEDREDGGAPGVAVLRHARAGDTDEGLDAVAQGRLGTGDRARVGELPVIHPVGGASLGCVLPGDECRDHVRLLAAESNHEDNEETVDRTDPVRPPPAVRVRESGSLAVIETTTGTYLMRATMKPIMKGDKNGEMMKPIVQTLS